MTVTLPVTMPRDYQLPFWRADADGFKRFILRWGRRGGKDFTGINFAAHKMMRRVGNYYHVLPFYTQGRKAIWEGKDKEGRPFLTAFPEELIAKRNEVEMKIELKNGSIWQVVGADKIDSLLSSNPVGLFFSEYSLMRPDVWNVMRPILAENEGWAAFAFTPRGKNHAYKLEQAALSLGLSPDLAPAMAQTLMRGSLNLKDASPQSAAALRQAVTSKGGTTEAGLSILMNPDSGLFPLLNATVQAAYRRAGGIR
jgi:hypothetical protein